MQDSSRARGLSPTMIQSAVGLMLLVAGAALFGIIAWLADFTWGGRSYRATLLFPNVGSMNVGTRVGYRGVRVGQVTRITPEPEGVAVEVEIAPASQIIPSNSIIEAVQSGLVGETSIDITPLQSLPSGGVSNPPLSPNCDPEIIICNGSRLQGQAALDVNTLIRSLVKISNLITDPNLIAIMRSLVQRTSTTLGKVNQLSGEATVVLKDVQRTGTVQDLNRGMRSLGSLEQLPTSIGQIGGNLQGLDGLSSEAIAVLRSLQAEGGLQNLNATLGEARQTLATVGDTAAQISTFLTDNQGRISRTLDSIEKTSNSLRTTINKLDPILTDVEKSQIISNLEQISTNAASLTRNLDNLSLYLGSKETVLQIQQLLDSARSAFENIEKLTSDVDEITGDPQLRQDIIRLIRGLNNLLSSSQQLQQDVLYGQALTQMAAEIVTLAPNQPPKIPPKKP